MEAVARKYFNPALRPRDSDSETVSRGGQQNRREAELYNYDYKQKWDQQVDRWDVERLRAEARLPDTTSPPQVRAGVVLSAQSGYASSGEQLFAVQRPRGQISLCQTI